MSGTKQIVVSLCDHTGNMVRPWASVGYECYAVDLKNDDTTETVNGNGQIHYVQADVREWTPPSDDVRIGFGFPPCTDLAVSGARWFQEKGLGALAEAIELVAATHDTLTELDCPWLIENPKSTLSTHWRKPDYKFNPYEYDAYTGRDERYTKETWLWTGGGFRMPRTDGVREREADDRIHKMPPSSDRSSKRAETPTGFARAVFLSHEQPDEYAIPGTGTEQDKLVTDGGTSGTKRTTVRELRDGTISITIDREMYESLRSKGSYIGETPEGVEVHISEDYSSIGRVKHPDDTPDMDAWSALFPVKDESEIPGTAPVTSHGSKTVMLEACPEDTIEITAVHEGMRRVPEKLEVTRRTNTYHGPVLRVKPADADHKEGDRYELTCPDKQSHLVLWQLVTDDEGYIQTEVKVAKVSAEIFNVAGYDMCESCGEPIKDPMHRSMAMFGTCNGGFNDE